MASDEVVKSVGRVFAVLEMFGASRAGLNATAIERELDYPKSSTLALLKSMVTLGYLTYDRIDRTYFPTIRVAHLGHWIDGASGQRDLQALIEDCAAITGETVTIACQNDLRMQFLIVRSGAKPLRINIQPGTTGPLFRSTMGLVVLALKSDAEIKRLADRLNRRTSNKDERVADLPSVMAQIAAIRCDGYGVGYGSYEPQVGVMSWALNRKAGSVPMVLSVGGEVESMRASEARILSQVSPILKSHGFHISTPPET